jgi:phospholipid transport system substrate-binding protein
MAKAIRLLIAASLVLLLPSLAAASDTEQAKRFLDGLGEKAIALAQDDKLVGAQKQAKLEALFVDYVDIDWVGKFVLGRYWKQATDAQKAQYLKNYQSFLLKHYTSKFTDYAGETFNITKAVTDGDNQYIVTMEIIRPHEANVIVDYRLREKAGIFQVFDIIVEGVSLITTQRSEFSSVISQKGLDHLIDQLAKKTESLAAASSKK